MKPLLCRTIFCIFASITALSISLCAGTIFYTFETTNYLGAGQPALWNQTFNLPKFNVPGAGLTKIDFRLSATTTMTASVNNTTNAAASYSYHSDSDVYFFFPSLPSLFLPYGLFADMPTGGTFQANPGPFLFTSSKSTSTNAASLGSNPNLPNPSIAPYLGQGFCHNLRFRG